MSRKILDSYYKEIKSDKTSFIDKMYNDPQAFEEFKNLIVSNPNMLKTIKFELGSGFDVNQDWDSTYGKNSNNNGIHEDRNAQNEHVGWVVGIGNNIKTPRNVGTDEETSYITFLEQYLDAEETAIGIVERWDDPDTPEVERGMNWASKVPPEAKYLLTDMVFNGGKGLVQKFPNMLKSLSKGDYVSMAKDLRYKSHDSKKMLDAEGNKIFEVPSDYWTQIGGSSWNDASTNTNGKVNKLFRYHPSNGQYQTQEYSDNRAWSHYKNIEQLKANATYSGVSTVFNP